jgi:DNA-directed RNA polymerase subunit RPC12/RpoP
MVDKVHCPTCGFLMMYTIEENETIYICANTHNIVGEDLDLGPNLDLLLEYLKRP